MSTDVDSFFRRWFSILIVLDQMNTWINADHTQMIPLLESALYIIDREVIVFILSVNISNNAFRIVPNATLAFNYMRIAIYDCIVQGVTIIRGAAFVATLEAFLSRVLDFCLCVD